MTDSLRWKIPFILVLMLVAVYVILSPQLPEGWPKSRLNLGFDLKGGVELRYQVVVKEDEEGKDDGSRQSGSLRERIAAKTDQTLDVIRKRLDPSGTRQPDIRAESGGEIIVRFPGISRAEVDRVDALVRQLGVLEFREVVPPGNYEAMSEAERKEKNVQLMQYRRAAREPGEEPQVVPTYVQRSDEYNLTGELLESVRPTTDTYGRPAVGFEFTETGAEIFGRMTNKLKGRGSIAIILNGEVRSAPAVKSEIRKSGIIEGDFTEEEIQDLVAVLRAGSLPVELELQSKTFVGPELGIDSRDRGYFAVKLSFILVVVFMLGYYLLSGAIADLALLMNLLFLFAAMMLTDAVLTLPGMAGVILTVGMAVDANVLIYERVREELDSGQSLRFAVRNGYGRAFTTIFDANLTTLITAIILYWQGTGAVRGFAVTLSIGIVVGMFTALFVTRTVFDLLIAKGWLRERLKMLRLMRNPAINFVRWAPLCIGASAVLIIAGMGVFLYRGHENYGIDFASGTAMQVQLKGYTATCSRVTPADEAAKSRFTVTFSEQLPGGRTVGVELPREVVQEGLRRLRDLPDQLLSEEARLKSDLSRLKGDDKRRAEARLSEIRDLAPASVHTDGLLLVWPDDAEKAGEVTFTVVEPEGDTSVGGTIAAFIDRMGDNVFRQRLNITEIRERVARAGYPYADVQAAFRDENVIGQYESDQFSIRVRAAGSETISEKDRERVPADIEQNLHDVVDLRAVPARVEVTPVLGADNTIAGGKVHVSFYITSLGEDNVTEPLRMKKVDVERSLGAVGFGDVTLLNWPATSDTAASIAFDTARTDLDRVRTELSVPGVFSFPVAFEGTYFVGPGQARKIIFQAWAAAVLSMIAIIIYVWLRFGALKYGLAAVAALAHDVLFALGALAAVAWLAETPLGEKLGIGDVRLSLPIVAGILTIIGYSLNDTIVVFDRVRENVRRRVRELRGKRSGGDTLTPEIIDLSINQTLSRTTLTSLTTLVVCVTLYVAAGVTLHGLSLCLIIGVVVGTYSSIFIASPILVLTHAFEQRRARAKGQLTTEEREVAVERGETEHK